MRILEISSAKNFGGGEKHFIDLTKGLIDKGHNLFIAVREDSPILERLGGFPKENILILNIKNSLDIFSAIKLSNFIKKNKIEIIHAHIAKDYLPASMAVRFSGAAKLILTRHVLFGMNSLYKFGLSNSSKAIAVSSGVEAQLEKIFPKDKIVKIPNGIDIENWAEADLEKLNIEFRAEHNIPPQAITIGIIGELKQLKGQEDFLLAAQLIAKKFPKAFFIVVGQDNSKMQEFRLRLRRLAKVFGLEEKFLWLNWAEDTKAFLSAIDIFTSASHSEAFGLAIVEAMAAKRAIISTKTDGAMEILKDNETALLTKIKDPVELAEKTCSLIEDADKRSTLGKAAQASARERFGLKKMIDETEKIFQEALADSQR